MKSNFDANERFLDQANWYACCKLDIKVYFLTHIPDQAFNGRYTYTEFMFTIKAIIAGIAREFNVSELQAEKIFCKKNKELLKQFQELNHEEKHYDSGLQFEYYLGQDFIGIGSLLIPAPLKKLLADNYFYNYIFACENTSKNYMHDKKFTYKAISVPTDLPSDLISQLPTKPKLTGISLCNMYNSLPMSEKVKFIEKCKQHSSQLAIELHQL